MGVRWDVFETFGRVSGRAASVKLQSCGYIVRSIQYLRAARVIAAYSRIHIGRLGSFK